MNNSYFSYFNVSYDFDTNKTTVELNHIDYSLKMLTEHELEYDTIGLTMIRTIQSL